MACHVRFDVFQLSNGSEKIDPPAGIGNHIENKISFLGLNVLSSSLKGTSII